MMTERHTASNFARDDLVVVLGMGKTGVSFARWLAANGGSAVFMDTRNEPPGRAEIAQLLPDAEFICGTLPTRLPAAARGVLISPGLGMNLPLLEDAWRRKVPVQSDIDLFMQACNGAVIGITGSNGKSTVTSMLDQMLSAAGIRVRAGGNLGTPALDLLDAETEVFVLELSSFQLERSAELPLHAAVVLNISPDHLDHHAGLDAYAAAKQRIYARCGTAIVNRDEPALAAGVPAGIPQTGFTLGIPASTDWGVIENADGQWIARGSSTVMPVRNLRIAGRHNIANALAAFALAETLDASVDGLVVGAQLFEGLPHRMQIVCSNGGVVWIDDSKATNEGAALASIGSIDGGLILIAGGDAKGGTFEALAAALAERKAAVILLGKDRDFIAARLYGISRMQLVADIEEAVSVAADWAQPGDTVLLAPACSSLDMFTSYAERGARFAAAVRSMPS